MKNLTKTIVWLSGLTASSLMLTACHENPLSAHSKRENIVTLQEAARRAENDLKLPAFKRGRTYLECMKGKASEVGCEQFFERMLTALKKKEGYGDMRLSDLTDKKMFASLSDRYEDKLFNTID